MRHPSFMRLLYHPNRAASGCERGKCDRGARGGSAPGRHRMFRFVVHPRPNPAASGLFREAFPIQRTSRGRAGGGPEDATSRRYRRDTPDEPLDRARRHPARHPVTHRASAPGGDKSTPRQPPPVSDKKQFGISLSRAETPTLTAPPQSSPQSFRPNRSACRSTAASSTSAPRTTASFTSPSSRMASSRTSPTSSPRTRKSPSGSSPSTPRRAASPSP